MRHAQSWHGWELLEGRQLLAVNLAPVNTVPGIQTTPEDTAKVFSAANGNLVSISDPDAGGGSAMSITLIFGSGTGTLSTITNLTFSTGDGTADGTMIFTGTITRVNNALSGLSFMPTSEFSGTASLTLMTNDQGASGTGGAQSDTDVVLITVTAVNDSPVVSGIEAATLGFTENAAATQITSAVTVSDVDTATMQSASVAITGNYQSAEDVLSFVNANNIVGNFNSTTGILSLLGADSIANYQAALRSVKYQNTSDNPSTAVRTVSFTVNDGNSNSAAATRTVTITAVNDVPSLAGMEGGVLAYAENDGPVAMTAALTISDADNTQIQSATVQITANYQNGQDVLAFADTGSITGSFNAATGTLTLTGPDTLANFRNALRSVTYENTSSNPSESQRTVSFIVSDGTANSSAATRNIAVTSVNDAPVLTAAGPSLTSIARDNITNSGALVSGVVGSAISDSDSGALQGIAVYASSATYGTWQYSLNAGTTWAAIGAVATNSALLLRATDKIRFVPDGSNSEAATLSYYAWDQTGATSGAQGTHVNATSRGGTTAFSTADDTVNISVNDAPVISADTPDLTGITEDDTNNAGDLVSDVISSTVSDVDANAVEGIAVFAVAPSQGAWQFSTDNGATWAALENVSVINALLLRSTDKVRFVPGSQNADTAGFSYYAWDRTSGVQGTYVNASSRGGTSAFSSAGDTASIAVSAANDAPVLTPAAPALTGIDEDQTDNAGQTVASIVGVSIADVDSGALQGIAVNAVTNSNGSWEYSTDGGTTWTAMGAVAADNALLLRSTDKVRFVPGSQNADTASFSYYAWDRTSGVQGTYADASSRGGASAFSSAGDTASIAVSAANDAPVLTPAAPALTGINEDQTDNAGQTVASIVGVSIVDVDSGAVQGIAVYAATNSNGSWEYSTDGGTTWAAMGAVAADSALLLRSTDKVRFVPDGSNSDSAGFSYYAWDRTSGVQGTYVDASSRGGTSAFSSAGDTASIAVSAANDAPVLTPAAPALTGINEDQTDNAGQTVASIVGVSIADVDSGAVQGIAVNAVTNSNGGWEYTTDGGTTWTAMGAVAADSALLLRSTDKVRFVPDGSNSDSAGFSYYAWDRTSGVQGTYEDASSRGGTSAFSSAGDTASIAVSTANDAPVLADDTLAIAEHAADGTEVGTVSGSDVDNGDDLTYVITAGNVGEVFAIDSDTGRITVADNSSLDYETTPSYSLTVRVTDGGGLSDTATITIDIIDANDPPTIEDAVFTVQEDASNAALVGTVSANDIDFGDSLGYEITAGNDDGIFTIDPTTGEISVADASGLNYETMTSYELTVRVSDQSDSYGTAAITINVTDVNEAPTVGSAEFILPESADNGRVVGSISGSDVDAGDDVTYSIVDGDPQGVFEIDPITGQITVADDSTLDQSITSTYQLTVQVQDNDGLTGSAVVTVNITRIDLTPAFSSATIADSWLPGTTGTVRVIVTNEGTAKSVDSFTVSLYAVPDEGDAVLLSNVPVQTVQLVPTAYRGYSILVTVPSNAVLPPGSYSLMCRVQYGDQINEATYDESFTAQEAFVDLTATLPAVVLPAGTLVPGDTGRVAVRVANSGNVPAIGEVTVCVYASASGQVDGDAVLLATTTGNIALGTAGQYTQYVLNVTIPQNGLDIEEDYQIVASVVAGAGITEGADLLLNNTVANEDAWTYQWQFGHVAERSNVVLTLTDPATDEIVSFSLVGLGSGEVQLDDLTGLLDVSLTDTTSLSVARITSTDASTIGDLAADSDMGALLAGQTTVRGSMTFDGGLRRLVVAGVGSDGGAQQTLSIAQVSEPLTADVTILALGAVYDLNINSTSPLVTLSAGTWADQVTGDDADLISAPWLYRLAVANGFAASLDLDPADAPAGTRAAPANRVLGSAAIGGAVTSPRWDVEGQIGALATGSISGLTLNARSLAGATVRGSLSDSVFTLDQALAARQLSLGKLTVTGAVETTDILSVGNVGAVSVGRMSGSRIFAGVKDGVTGLPVAGNFVEPNGAGLQASITQFLLTGLRTYGAAATLFEDSTVAAGTLGKVRLEGVATDNSDSFGFAADRRIGDLVWLEDSVLVGRFAGTSWTRGPSLPEGDFVVRVV